MKENKNETNKLEDKKSKRTYKSAIIVAILGLIGVISVPIINKIGCQSDVNKPNQSKEILIKGWVFDENGNPIKNIKVEIKEDNKAEFTDSDGKFYFKFYGKKEKLIYTFKVYNGSSVIFENKIPIDFSLDKEEILLDEFRIKREKIVVKDIPENDYMYAKVIVKDIEKKKIKGAKVVINSDEKFSGQTTETGEVIIKVPKNMLNNRQANISATFNGLQGTVIQSIDENTIFITIK